MHCICTVETDKNPWVHTLAFLVEKYQLMHVQLGHNIISY